MFTFEAMTEDLLQDGNKVNELLRSVVDRLKTGAVQQSLHGKPESKENANALFYLSVQKVLLVPLQE